MKPNEKTAIVISAVNMVINVVLAVLKLTVGTLAHSGALVSDGVHSVADVFSSVVVLIGVKLSAHRSDRLHPYGYERMECVAAVILAVLIGVTGVGIGAAGVRSVLSPTTETAMMSGTAALITASAAVGIKEIMFHYTRFAAKKTASAALMADAWHLRTDVLSSLGGFIGILGARLGVPVLDPIAAVFISLLIIKAAVGIFADAMKKMTDRSCDRSLQEDIYACILTQNGVLGIEDMKTRLFGNRVYVEATVTVDGALSSKNAYDISQAVHAAVENTFESVKECAVHIHPL